MVLCATRGQLTCPLQSMCVMLVLLVLETAQLCAGVLLLAKQLAYGMSHSSNKKIYVWFKLVKVCAI